MLLKRFCRKDSLEKKASIAAGSFFTEPQHASSMRTTFAKLYVEGFRSLQKLLSGNASARSQNGSEVSSKLGSFTLSYVQPPHYLPTRMIEPRAAMSTELTGEMQCMHVRRACRH